MFKFENIQKTFKTDFWKKEFSALKGVSFSVEEAKITGFLGANGAGKTTSLKILLGFLRPSGGDVTFSQCLGRNFQEVLGNIGYFPERPYFYKHLTAREYLRYMGELQGLKYKEIKTQSEYWLERLNIGAFIDRKIINYSKGMQQRLGLASVLLHDPMFIILDEPLSGLDPIGRQDFKDVFRELNRKGKSLFFSSHIVHDIEEICHNVVVLDKGELLYQGKISDILDQSSEEFFRARIKKTELIISDVRVISENDEYQVLEFDTDKKDKVISEVVSKGIMLESLVPKRKNLEEIVYKLKKYE